MIERVEGDVLEVGAGFVVVQISGIAVRLQAPRLSAARLEPRGRAALWTRLLVRDGDPQLYGFVTRAERDCFDALLGVNGVGPRIALAILSHLEPSGLALALESGGLAAFEKVPGVGRKLASRILLELKGRLPAEIEAPSGVGAVSAERAADALRALTALGYSGVEAQEAVRQALRGARDGEEPPPLDVVLRSALTSLNRRAG
jgi:Holliday junction DNA helicase RuvA